MTIPASAVPEGAAQYMRLRELAAVLHRAVVVAVLVGVMFLLGRAQIPAEPWAGWLLLATAVVVMVLTSWLFSRLTTAALDRLGRRREARTEAERLAWARQRGWAYEPGPQPIASADASLILAPKAGPVHACRSLRGRVRGGPARIETWLLAVPRRRLRYRRGGRRLPFWPGLATVIVLQTQHRLPLTGFFSYVFPRMPEGLPESLAGQELTNQPTIAKKLVSPQMATDEVLRRVETQLLQLRRPPMRIVAADHQVVMMSFDEPDMDTVSERLEMLADLAEGLAL